MKERSSRSLKASSVGLTRANKAILSFISKIDFAAELEISRATVQKFFAGKTVGRENFHKICRRLELPWQEIADLADLAEDIQPEPQEVANHNGCDDVDTLVQELRDKGRASIKQKCGMMRVLDMSQPIGLDDIYTNVNILEKISGRRRLEIEDIVKSCGSDEFDRPGFGRIAQDRVPGIEALQKFSKLIILGKPGAGKTTFLKHVAIKCSLGEFQTHRVPIFITLKDFAEHEQQPSLVEYISEEFYTYGIKNAGAVAEEILSKGKALVLLDGLDEIREKDSYSVLQEVRKFSTKFHSNHFIITCRIATREYTFEEFTEVEIADFDEEQISSFASKWFAAKDSNKSNKFVEKLQENSPVRELATNPLLLTLLCLMFEESADFPSNRSELYKEALNVLLRKWDAKRNIEREQIYKKLLVVHKEDLLSKIALITFERGDYFFRQKELEHYITDYIRNIPEVSTKVEELQLDSEAVVKSIEAQHGLLVERARGIYSFSHLTFQEYFAAREIVTSSDPLAKKTTLNQLVSRVTEKRWHEVFLLTVGMLRNADYLLQLMKQQIEQLVAEDEQLQAFLTWVSQKSCAVADPDRLVTVRAFYFDIDLARILDLVGGTLDLARTLNSNITRELDNELALDLALDRTLALNRVLDTTPEPSRAINRVLDRAIARARSVESEREREVTRSTLSESLQQLKEQISDADKEGKGFEEWWKANGKAWTEQLRAAMVSYRNIGHDWQFSARQKQKLKQYYDANQLLVDCLNSHCYATRTVREEISETLLLPGGEVKQRKALVLI